MKKEPNKELQRVMTQRNLYRELLIAGGIIAPYEHFTEIAERVGQAKQQAKDKT